ncbi:MAG TPA: FAD:protein FMN transferase [Acidimicrobiia bacterium]|nr:FAD:protein FMN transferase [Acidimicrobiia bacterium]
MQRTSTRRLPPPVRFRALGTTAVVAVTDARVRDEAAEMLALELDAIDAACSRFRDDSELSRVNAAAGAWVAVSPLFLAALQVALTAARTTDGLVDPTLGRALRVLGYDRDFESVAADGPPLRVRVERTAGWRAVGVDSVSRRVRVPRTVELDLGATAKAFAADRAAARIAAVTGSGVIVDLGGDCSIAGESPEGGWTVRVTDRHDASADAPGATIALSAGGLATSGITARRWIRGGRELHHVVDPHTGWPARAVWRTASVAAATCVDANVASTAAIVLGYGAHAFLEARGYPARLVAGDSSVEVLGGWPHEIED